MVNPNDPAAIPYVISEDNGVFWYVAYKEKNHGVPYITVSAKGVANGLSTEYNDGYDFGPDSYNPNISSGIPLTQTAGIYEALLYYISIHEQEDLNIDVPHLLSGTYIINNPMPPLVITKNMGLPLGLVGENLLTTSLQLNYSSSTAFFTIDNNSLNNLNSMNFRFHNFNVGNPTQGTAPFFDVDFSSSTSIYSNVLEISDFTLGDQVGQTAINAVGFQFIIVRSLQNYGSTLNLNSTIININSSIGAYGNIIVSGGGTYSGGALYLHDVSSVVISGNANFVAIDGSPLPNSYVTIGLSNSTTPITIGTLVIKNIAGQPSSFLINNLAATATINNLIIKDITSTNLPSDTEFISNPNGGNLVINNLDIDGIFSNNNYKWIGIPFNSTTNGTTAGTVVIQSKTYKPDYKKYLITFTGYENDTTTAQTIDFPSPFTTSAAISANNTGLTISASTSGITITAPDSTTTYSGIVIVEGY